MDMKVDIGNRLAVVGQKIVSLEPNVLIAVIVASLVLLVCFPYLKNLGKNLPPGPPAWPIFGSLMYLGGELHHALWDLSKKYGPVMQLGLGQHNLIVISSAEAAEEVMRKKDMEFCHRAGRAIQRSAAKYVGIDSNDIAFADYTPQLKLLRKFCTTELFTNARLIASAQIRSREVGVMLSAFHELAAKGEDVEVREYLHTMTMNSICLMCFGKRFYGEDLPATAERQNFAKVVRDVFDNVGKLNLADLIPFLRWFDLQGIEAEWKRIRPQAEKVLGQLIEEHRETLSLRGMGRMEQDSMDFVDVLLTAEGNEKVSNQAIFGLLLDMVLGGTDTAATSIEWCMVEVIRNPKMMQRLQEELDDVVGKERQVEESDLPQLPYLLAFVKEVFRLHTTVPICLPRLNDKAATIAGYDVSPLSTIFINIYAIAHDPKYWEKPMEFNPDRFLTNKIGLMGTDFELLPFGSGRRKCVGIQLGINSVSRCLGALVHAFDWAPTAGSKPLDVDISESYLLVLRNRVPLRAKATPRLARSPYDKKSGT